MIRNEPKQFYIYDHSLGRGTPIYATHDEKVTYSGEFSAIEYHAIEFSAYFELLAKYERVLRMLEMAERALEKINGSLKIAREGHPIGLTTSQMIKCADEALAQIEESK